MLLEHRRGTADDAGADQDNVEGTEASLMATAFDPFRTFGPVHELEIPRVPFF